MYIGYISILSRDQMYGKVNKYMIPQDSAPVCFYHSFHMNIKLTHWP